MNLPGPCRIVDPAPHSAASGRPAREPIPPDAQSKHLAQPAQLAAQAGASDQPEPTCPERTRLRLRFRKLGVMRLVGHQDLVRVWDRAFRRAGLPLRMSQGFHPKPRLSFPAALALGVASLDEVLEAEFAARVAPHEVWRRLADELPPGLELAAVERLPQRGPAARLMRAHYVFPLPPTRQAPAAQAAARLCEAAGPLLVPRAGKPAVDLRAALCTLEVRGGVLRFSIAAGSAGPAAAGSDAPQAGTASRDSGSDAGRGAVGTPRPHDVLSALGLADLLAAGAYLTRTRVELAPCPQE